MSWYNCSDNNKNSGRYSEIEQISKQNEASDAKSNEKRRKNWSNNRNMVNKNKRTEIRIILTAPKQKTKTN